MNTLHQAIKLLTKREQIQGVWVLILMIGMALLETVGVASVMPFLAVLGSPEMLNTSLILRTLYANAKKYSISTPEEFLILLGAGAFTLILLSAGFRTVTHYVMNRFIEMKRYSIGTRLLETYMKQPYVFFLDRHVCEMSKSILTEVDLLIINIFRPVFAMAAYIFVLITILVLLLVVNPWLAILAAGTLGCLYLLVFTGLKSRLADLGKKLVVANKNRFLASDEAFSGIKEVKLMGSESAYLQRFRKYSEGYAEAIASYQTISQVPNFLIEGLIFGTVVLLVLALMNADGGLRSGLLGQILPILGLYAFAAYRMKPAVQSIYQGFASLRYGRSNVENIYKELYQQGTIDRLPEKKYEQIKPKTKVSLKNLSYKYPKSAKESLVDVNLDIPVGTSVGIVGASGAGKTTLVDTILGLLRPIQGAITVDDIVITDELLRKWQNSLGYVPQDVFLTDRTISENIAFGIALENIDMKQVEKCAQMAQLHDFIVESLPEKYATRVGERGVRLSGGQRQRIGIARALYHNPSVLVLDEATSALDSLTEQAVMSEIDSLANQKTIIIIAHRLTTVQNCRQIVLIKNGKIEKIGSYSDVVGHENEN